MKKYFVSGVILFLGCTAGATNYYVNVANTAGEAFPYDTPATASTNIQEAVGQAGDGDTVWVADGTYLLSSGINVYNDITIESVNGPEVTVVDGQGSCRGFYLSDSACILDGFTITNCYSAENGGGIYCSSTDPIITHCTITGNSSLINGGGSYLGTLNHCTLSGNEAFIGGGSYGGTLNHCTLSGNSVGNYGGGSNRGTLNNCLIVDNYSEDVGGGSAGGMLNNCTLSDNEAENDGGGSAADTLNNCILYGNVVSNAPNEHVGSTLNSCSTNDPTFMDASAGNYRLQSISTSCLDQGNNTYTNCTTDLDGNPRVVNGTVDIGAYEFGSGSVYYVNVSNAAPSSPYSTWGTAATEFQSAIDQAADGDTVRVADGTYLLSSGIEVFKNITIESVNGPEVTLVDGQGTCGGFNLGDSDCILNGFTITNGYSTIGGGGIYCMSTNPVINNCTLIGNSTLNGGGGSHEGTLNHCTLTGNSVSFGSGGGSYRGILNHCTLSGNRASASGGGSNFGTLNDCTLSGNSAGYEGGGSDHSTLNNCTLLNNEAVEGGGSYRGTLNHCELTGNTATNSGGGSYEATLNNCTLSGNESGDGGGSYDSTLNNCTLAGNLATNSGGGCFESTLNNCIVWGNSATNSGQNIYESTCQNTCAPDVEPHFLNGCITNNPLFVDEINGNFRLQTTSPCIDAGDNAYTNSTTDLDGNPRIRNNPVDLGAYECTEVRVHLPYYVNGTNSNPQPPYDTAQNAANTIQEVLPYTLDGDQIWVSDGTYSLLGEIVVTNDIKITSLNGPEVTLMDGGQNGRCFNLGATAARIQGFTITNGITTGHGGGVTAETQDATLVDCVITGNSAYSGGGAHQCTLTRCTLRGNTASNAGGAISSSIANSCLIKDNFSSSIGGGIYEGTANNCNVISNSATWGGGVYRGTVNNSIIWGNSASNSSNELYETTAHHSCSPELTADANGNISENPRFKDIAAGNVHLLYGSPCLDSGTNLYVATTLDLDGTARIKNTVVDMGVYDVSAIYVATTGDDAEDGLSWATAKATLQAAVDIATDGDLIRVNAGSYTLTSEVLVTNAVTIYSENGPENTIVDGNNISTCFDLGTNACTISGFTITQGRYRAIECADLTPIVTNCLISANAGNALYKGTAISCTFSNNVVSGYGGAMRDGAAINCLFIHNSATYGGAMHNGTASSCTFIENSASSYGGAIITVMASNCIFTANTANNNGGAGSQCTLFNCTLRNNSAKYLGGALQYGTANNCTFINNSARRHGGAQYYGTVNNCVFTGNQATEDGGAMCYGTANNCTFTQNTAFSGGGTSRTAINNCILWNNSAEKQGDNFYGGTPRYTCSPDVTPGSYGCITNNPMLISASHIATNSPCIGKGSADYATGTDLDGESWQSPPAMGCDESIGGSVSGPIVPILTTPEVICQGYDATLETFFEGAVTRTTLNFGDGNTVTNMSASLSHTWGSFGTYEVILTGYNDETPAGVSTTNNVLIRSSATCAIHVSDATGSDTNNGSSAHPKKTIQAGVEAQEFEGGFVYVDDGTYAITNEIRIDKNIRLTSQNNAELTTIESDGIARCFELMNSRCVVNGFTITHSGGRGEDSSSGAAIDCSGTRPLVSNCILTENTGSSPSAMQGGTASACSFIDNNGNGNGTMKNGVAENCTFSGNTSSSYGGAIYDCVARFCTFQDNSAQYGGAQYGGTATQCKFIRNTASKSGGAISSGIVINSTIQGNVAPEYGGGMYSGTAINCTFCDNRSAQGGGSYSSTIQNCILWNNTATIEGNNLLYGTINYSCAPELTDGEDGNSCTNPLLLSPSHIATNSPCVGAGSALYATGNDIDDDAWNNPPSMGCDEISPPMQGDITLSLSGPTTICAGFPATYTFIVEGEITQSTVSFDDGTHVDNPITTSLQHSWNEPGPYTIRANAIHQDTGWTAILYDIEVVDAASNAIYVATSGNNSSNGTSWATAKQTLQGGIDAQNLVGGQVIVSNGVYTLAETILIDKTLQLIALNGAEETIIDAVNLYDLDYQNSRALEIGDVGCRVDGFTIRNTQYGWTGGAIYCDSTAPQIVNCILRDNTAGTAGGMFGGTAIDCTFTNCSATTGLGGGLYAGIASNTIFVQNYARNGAGGMYYGIASDCSFIGNQTPQGSGYGGGMRGGTATNCTFKNNVAGYGGGIADGTAIDSSFFENIGLYRGGGANESTLTRCIFVGNTALLNGGGAYSCTANSCFFTANTAEEDGGGFYYGTANNCTLTGNRAGEVSGGMGYAYVNNCIVWGNTAGIRGNDIDYVHAAHNTCCPDLTHGSNGCITNNPLLTSSSQLSVNSPCLGKGDALYSTGTDLDGYAWRNPPAMGCDEPALGGPVEMALIGPSPIAQGVSADYTALFIGYTSWTTVDFDDESPLVDKAVDSIAHKWTAPGSYDVVLTAYNSDYSFGISFTQTVEVVSSASTIHVALTGDDANDGLTWATAKVSIQAGVDAQTIYGGQVVISNGTYALSEAIEINDPIHLVGLGDYQAVTIDAGGSNRCFNLGYQACIIDNLIITNGATATSGLNTHIGGGINCIGYAPVITNCWITGCLSYNGGGISKGTVIDSALMNNTAVGHGGALAESRVFHSALIDNHANYGGGAYESQLDRCLISGNIASADGGGIYSYSSSGTAQNCDIRNNTATNKGGGSASGSYGGPLRNCTVVGNTADYGGGIHGGDVLNCIVWYNTAPSFPNMSSTADSSCSPDLSNGFGHYNNITNAPVFYDWASGNYRLSRFSPCLNAGDNQYVTTEEDFDGEQRTQYGIVDMGAYEVFLGDDDTDGDDMTDAWELENFGGITTAVGTEDADTDDFDNRSEYIAGTDPHDDTAYLRIVQSEMVPDSEDPNLTLIYLEWAPSVEGRIYGISSSTNLVEGFHDTGNVVPYPHDNHIIGNTHPSAYYKINVRLDD